MRDREGDTGGETQGEKVLMRKRSGHRSKVIHITSNQSYSSHKGANAHCGKMNADVGGMLMWKAIHFQR